MTQRPAPFASPAADLRPQGEGMGTTAGGPARQAAASARPRSWPLAPGTKIGGATLACPHSMGAALQIRTRPRNRTAKPDRSGPPQRLHTPPGHSRHRIRLGPPLSRMGREWAEGLAAGPASWPARGRGPARPFFHGAAAPHPAATAAATAAASTAVAAPDPR